MFFCPVCMCLDVAPAPMYRQAPSYGTDVRDEGSMPPLPVSVPPQWVTQDRRESDGEAWTLSTYDSGPRNYGYLYTRQGWCYLQAIGMCLECAPTYTK